MSTAVEGRSVIPVLGDRKDYGTWKKEVMIWRIGTGASKQQQASKLIMMMDGKARETAINIEPDLLKSGDGVENLFLELDALYNKDSTQNIIKAIDEFESYRRNDREDIDAFIQEFSRRYKRLQRLRDNKALYDDAVLAIRLLNQASLNAEQKRLIKATCKELKYTTMVEQLRKAYGDGLCPSTSSDAARSDAIKVEPDDPQVFFHGQVAGFQRQPYVHAPQHPWQQSYTGSSNTPGAAAQYQHSDSWYGEIPKNNSSKSNEWCMICHVSGHRIQDCPYNDFKK